MSISTVISETTFLMNLSHLPFDLRVCALSQNHFCELSVQHDLFTPLEASRCLEASVCLKQDTPQSLVLDVDFMSKNMMNSYQKMPFLE